MRSDFFSKPILCFFRFITPFMLMAQSIPSSMRKGLLSSTIYITSKPASMLAPSISTVIRYNIPIDRIFCWFIIHNLIGYHCSASLPMRSHVYFGRMIVSNPRFKITCSISYSPICEINIISLPVHIVHFQSFRTMCGSFGVVLAHIVMSSCSPFIALVSCSSFMHVSKNVVSINGPISGSSLSLLPEVEASAKLLLASMNVSLAHSKSNSGSFVGSLRTQSLSSSCLPLSSPIVTPLWSMIFTFGSSSCG